MANLPVDIMCNSHVGNWMTWRQEAREAPYPCCNAGDRTLWNKVVWPASNEAGPQAGSSRRDGGGESRQVKTCSKICDIAAILQDEWWCIWGGKSLDEEKLNSGLFQSFSGCAQSGEVPGDSNKPLNMHFILFWFSHILCIFWHFYCIFCTFPPPPHLIVDKKYNLLPILNGIHRWMPEKVSNFHLSFGLVWNLRPWKFS